MWQEKPIETFPEIYTQFEKARVDFHKKIFIQTPYATQRRASILTDDCYATIMVVHSEV